MNSLSSRARILVGAAPLVAAVLASCATPPSVSHPGPAGARGPLKPFAANPRFFTDGSGHAVVLMGSHSWNNLQDCTYAAKPSPPRMDFDGYLDFMVADNLNFFRLWTFESPVNPGALASTTYFDPMPFLRTGPGVAADGKPRFDLSRFNPAYFERMRARVAAAQQRGIYVSVMLFNGFSIEGKGNDGGDPWADHPLNPANNINGMDGGGSGAVHTLRQRRIVAWQEAYIRHVIDTVNGLDNVLYEISNEDTGSGEDRDWQIHMVDYIKAYEATKPKQHPVGMTSMWPKGDDDALMAGPADWVSPNHPLAIFDGTKVILNDTDHSYYWTLMREDGPEAQRLWVWENFFDGNQCLFMDPYLDGSHDPGRNDPKDGKPDVYWDVLRKSMGQVRTYAAGLDLAVLKPRPALSSTRFCLADPGRDYVALRRGGRTGPTVTLATAPGRYRVEWYDLRSARVATGSEVQGGPAAQVASPFAGPSIVRLRLIPTP